MLGIVGGNGAGKSTFLRCVVGDSDPDAGSVEIGDSVHLGVVSQSRADLDDKRSVYEEISDGVGEVLDLGNGKTVQTRAYVADFNLKGAAQEKLVGSLSGGERNRVHIAKVLTQRCNLLMLDEPTNDLDVETMRSL